MTRGVLYDDRSEIVSGFWDVMMKRCYLFTATIERYMEDIMFKLFNIKSEQFKKYKLFLTQKYVGSCTTSTSYHVGKTDAQYWELIRDKIKSQRLTKPIIVFVKEKVKVKMLKRFAQEFRLPFYEALTDT